MKTIIALIVSAMLAACGNSSTDTPAPDAAASAPDAQTNGAGGGGRR